MKRETYYKSEKWLNSNDSPSTESIVCYDGDIEYTEGISPCVFVEVSDCNVKARLHMSHTDNVDDFISKINSMIQELQLFKYHLTKISPHKPEGSVTDQRDLVS